MNHTQRQIDTTHLQRILHGIKRNFRNFVVVFSMRILFIYLYGGFFVYYVGLIFLRVYRLWLLGSDCQWGYSMFADLRVCLFNSFFFSLRCCLLLLCAYQQTFCSRITLANNQCTNTVNYHRMHTGEWKRRENEKRKKKHTIRKQIRHTWNSLPFARPIRRFIQRLHMNGPGLISSNISQ